MSKHDYSQNTVAAISDAITNSKNEVDNAILSIESMAYSWEAEVIQNVVTSFEVLDIIDQKKQIGSLFEKQVKDLTITCKGIEHIDLNVSKNLLKTLDILKRVRAKTNEIQDMSLKLKKESSSNSLINNHNKTQNVDQTVKSAKFPISSKIANILNKYYSITENGQNFKINVSQIIFSNIYYINYLTDTNIFNSIIDSVQEGKMKINNGKVEIGVIGSYTISIETENSIDINNEIHDLKEALTTCSFSEMTEKGTYSIEEDGALKYSYGKKINNGVSLDISVSFNPNTKESKIKCKIKYTDVNEKTNHSISLNLKKIANMDLTPVSQYEFSNASEIYVKEMNCWQKAVKWTDDIMSELKYQTNKTTDQISDSMISLMEKTYNFTRDKVLGFPNLLRNLNHAIDERDTTMICFAIMAILVSAAEIGGCLVLA